MSPLSPFLSLPFSASITPSRSFAFTLPFAIPMLSPLSFLSPGYKLSSLFLSLSLFPSIFPRTPYLLFLSSLSMCPPFHFLSFSGLFPLPFALSPSHVLYHLRFHFTLLTLLLPTLRRPPRGGPFSIAEECTWDRSDKRNCANKYAHADNCTINRSWLVKRGRLNALTCSGYS